MNPEASREIFVHDDPDLLSLKLLIAADICKLRIGFEQIHKFRRPLQELLQMIRSQGVLILPLARATTHAEILHGTQEEFCPLDCCEFRSQAIDDFINMDFANRERFERNEHAAIIHRAATAAADHGGDRFHGGILGDDLCQPLLLDLHGCIGDVLGALGNSGDQSRILLGKKPLGDHGIKKKGCRDGDQSEQKGQARVP